MRRANPGDIPLILGLSYVSHPPNPLWVQICWEAVFLPLQSKKETPLPDSSPWEAPGSTFAWPLTGPLSKQIRLGYQYR